MRASSRIIARSSSSASSARPCTWSTSAWRSPTSETLTADLPALPRGLVRLDPMPPADEIQTLSDRRLAADDRAGRTGCACSTSRPTGSGTPSSRSSSRCRRCWSGWVPLANETRPIRAGVGEPAVRSCCASPSSISAPGSCRLRVLALARAVRRHRTTASCHYVVASNWGSALLVWLMLPASLVRPRSGPTAADGRRRSRCGIFVVDAWCCPGG